MVFDAQTTQDLQAVFDRLATDGRIDAAALLPHADETAICALALLSLTTACMCAMCKFSRHRNSEMRRVMETNVAQSLSAGTTFQKFQG